MNDQSELELLQLAKNATDWDKVRLFELLANTKNPEIKRWMVREGYRDECRMDDLAYFCATTGDLLSELRNSNPDSDVLIGAGHILEGLIEGYGRYDIGDYDDGPEAVSLYLTHIAKQPDLTLAQLRTIAGIADFVADGHYTYTWDDLLPKGWSEDRRSAIRTKAEAIIKQPQWKPKVQAQLERIGDPNFDIAAFVGTAIGIDVRPYRDERQKLQKDNE